MHLHSRRAALGAALTLLVAACGGKGDAGDGTIALTFAEASAAGATYVGQPSPAEVPLHVSLSRVPPGAFSFAPSGAEAAFEPAVRTEAVSATSYVVYLRPRADLAQGVQSGTLLLRLCADEGCASSLPASGNSLHYQLVVSAGLEVTIRVRGAAPATATPASPASVSVLAPATVELDANAPMAWAWTPATDGPQAAPSGDSSATAWKAIVSLPDGVDAADLVLTGTAQDGSGATVKATLAVARPVVAGAYGTGIYPDLFVELLGKTDAQVTAKVQAAWDQYFGTGEGRVFYTVGDDLGYVLDTGNGDIRSEGMSYGMMIAVQLDHQDVFDRLWRFARTYSRYADGEWKGYLAWQLSPTGPGYEKLGLSNASDGEEWYATALLMAANRWGNAGAFDYQADAQAILDTMLHKHEQADRGAVTDMFDATTHQVVFVASGDSALFTDPSYHLPHFYELWAAWGDKDHDRWCAAAAASRAFLASTTDATTGLAPDYARFDGTAYGPSWGPEHANFEYDAFRVGANLGVDHLWFQKDPWQTTEADRLLGFFHAKGASYPSLWTLSGTPLDVSWNGPHGAGLAGTNAALALAASSDALRTEFVRALWNASPPVGRYRYYDGLLYTLALLQVSGNFRVHHPAGGPVAVCP